MTDKEQLTQLTSHIRKLVELTEQMHETEIYPVSFFSESFDLIYKIQDRLHAMEMGQIELFDQKIREHQAQISSVDRPVRRTAAGLMEAIHPPILATDERSSAPSVPPVPVSRNTAPPVASSSFKMEKAKLTDLRKAFTLNDRFRFCRELFGGDEQQMNRVISELNETASYGQALVLLKNVTDWDFENDSVIDFLKLVERRFL